ncbi:hypothetical protein KI387_003129, partial [Taxus chinensis]
MVMNTTLACNMALSLSVFNVATNGPHANLRVITYGSTYTPTPLFPPSITLTLGLGGLSGDIGICKVPRLVRSSSVAESTGTKGLVRSSSVAETTSRGADSVIVPTRWKPTPEQKHILESMFANGIRNPSTSYITEITADLQRYGRVEGKNVFYWFQNANARDKRKKEPSQSKR